MTTNYGKRPGIMLDGDANYWRGKVAEAEREIAGLTHERDVARLACENLTAMRDAARADVERLREHCESALALLREVKRSGVCVNAAASHMIDALKRAEGERRPEGARATEAGKDGAK